MSDFQPGDVVVCVDDSPCTSQSHDHTEPCPWKKGEIGRVISVYKYGLELHPRKHPEHTYIAAYRFRKIRPADESFTRQMRALRPIKTKEHA
jgi:hypothetical protein